MGISDKFLTFGNDNVFFFEQKTNRDFIAIEPICRFFGADYTNELINLKTNFFGEELITQKGWYDGKFKELIFIPIMYVIGWIPNIENPKKSTIEYIIKHF